MSHNTVGCLMQDPEMRQFFQAEIKAQTEILSKALLQLERLSCIAKHSDDFVRFLMTCLQAAHSIKGVCAMMDFQAGIDIARDMETCFTRAKQNQGDAIPVDILLKKIDMLSKLAFPAISHFHAEEIIGNSDNTENSTYSFVHSSSNRNIRPNSLDQIVRLCHQSHIMFDEMQIIEKIFQRLQHMHLATIDCLDVLDQPQGDQVKTLLGNAQQLLLDYLPRFKKYRAQVDEIWRQLSDQTMQWQYCSFGERMRVYKRMVRDISHSLGKKVRLEIKGKQVLINRDVAERLDAAFIHLIRNAVDHGIELPDQRVAVGKVAEGTIILSASQEQGQCLIEIRDDGGGISLDQLRAFLIKQAIVDSDTVCKMSEEALIHCLLLPGVSLSSRVTDFSGCGMGLDAVHTLVKSVGGTLQIDHQPGQGLCFRWQLPHTLSILRCWIVHVANEWYAVPSVHIVTMILLPTDTVRIDSGQEIFTFEGKDLPLIDMHGVHQRCCPLLSIVILAGQKDVAMVGLVVDNLMDEQVLIMRALGAPHSYQDRHFRHLHTTAMGFQANGHALFILDVESLCQMRINVTQNSKLDHSQQDSCSGAQRILLAIPSLAARELIACCLQRRGYMVTAVIDGIDAWNVLHTAPYNMVIGAKTMPRLGGQKLRMLMKGDEMLKNLPIFILSDNHFFQRGYDDMLFKAIASLMERKK